MFCSACGSRLEATNKFCPSCGHKAVGKSEASSKKDDRKDIKCLSFEQFAAKKSRKGRHISEPRPRPKPSRKI